LEAAGGRLVRFDSVAHGRVTFVAFWSRRCGPSLEELPALDHMAARLEREGIGVVTVTDERVSEELRRFLAAKGFSFPVYADVWRDASRAFSQWGTPCIMS
jgi:thiol-disulfide isomerase/thioredoxin